MIIESLVATAVVFLLIVIVTEIAFAIVAQTTTRTAVMATARRAGRPGSIPGVEQQRLADELARIVPGASRVDAVVEFDSGSVTAHAEVRWIPPGPDLVPITLSATATAPLVVPP